MKRIIKYAILTACGIALFLVVNYAGTMHRGYAAIGGEGFFILLPVLWWIVETVIRDFKHKP